MVVQSPFDRWRSRVASVLRTERILVLGLTPLAKQVIAEIQARPRRRVIVGVFDDREFTTTGRPTWPRSRRRSTGCSRTASSSRWRAPRPDPDADAARVAASGAADRRRRRRLLRAPHRQDRARVADADEHHPLGPLLPADGAAADGAAPSALSWRRWLCASPHLCSRW